MDKKLNIGFVGLSHLGLTTSIAISSFKSVIVKAYDENESLINNLNNKIVSLKEPNLKNYLKKNFKRITFTNNNKDLKNCDIVYISQDVSTDPKNKADLIKLKKTINNTIKVISNNAILVIHSQIQLDFMNSISWPKHKLFYHVETLVFGNAIERVISPERLIIGSYNVNKKIPHKLNKYLNLFKSKIIIMNYHSAELTKISINLFLMSSISTTNQIAKLCENSNADWSKIKEAVILDKRIGKYSYTDPGLGISGGNLERDLTAIIDLNNRYNISNNFFYSIENLSNERKKWIFNNLNNLNYKDNKNLKIGLLGVCYKANTNSVKNSPGIAILKKFKKSIVKFYDPLISDIKISKNHNRVNKLNEVFSDIDLLIISNNWTIYSKINISDLSKIKNKLIIDPFNVLHKFNMSKLQINHIILGKKT